MCTRGSGIPCARLRIGHGLNEPFSCISRSDRLHSVPMEPTAIHFLREPCSLSEAMGCDGDHLYPVRGSRDSELLKAFGNENPYQVEPNWTTEGYSVSFQEMSYDYPPKSPEIAVSGVNAIPQRPSFDGNEDSEPVHCYIHNTNHEVPHNNDSTYHVVPGSETSGFLVPRAMTVPDTARDMERRPRSAEEFTGGTPQEGISRTSFLASLQRTGEHPLPSGDYSITSRYPSDSNYILGFVGRSDGGGATCLWQNQGDTCGFFSHVDLVKRHIKRMHICLK